MIEFKFKGEDKIKAVAIIANSDLDNDKDYKLIIKEDKAKRSLNANALFWEYCGRLAAVTRVPKTEIYRNYIRDIGGNSEMLCIRNDAVERFIEKWEQGHIGRIAEVLQPAEKIPNHTVVTIYYGSSDYDNTQMSRLINLLMQDCINNGIMTPEQEDLNRLCEEWGKMNEA